VRAARRVVEQSYDLSCRRRRASDRARVGLILPTGTPSVALISAYGRLGARHEHLDQRLLAAVQPPKRVARLGGLSPRCGGDIEPVEAPRIQSAMRKKRVQAHLRPAA
jgi:hypothetical protein